MQAPDGRGHRGGVGRAGFAMLAVALAVAAGTAVAGCAATPSVTAPTSAPTTAPPATTGSALPTTTTAAPTTTTTTAAQATTTTTVPVLGPGDTGPAVAELQARLTFLHYWVGTADGTYGDTTVQAVYALQKAAGITRDGVAGPVTDAALARGVEPHPAPATGRVIEVDLTDDLLMFVTGGTLQWVLNTSTGGGYTYTATGHAALAETPVGRFTIYRAVDGLVTDSLGQLWRPRYFTDGFAIHGDSSVPPVPVSHGCVRVSNEAIDWIWSTDLAPIGTAVWVY
jgi:peptidoglycan hydrolase-like protein with peptidoglycan-binding domain